MSIMSPERENIEIVGNSLPDYLPPVYKKFFRGLLVGYLRLPSELEVDEAVKEQFAYEPLIPLDTKKQTQLEADMRKQINATFNREVWRDIADEMYLIPQGLNVDEFRWTHSNSSSGYLAIGKGMHDIADRFGLKPLNPQEKEKHLTDPDFYENTPKIKKHDHGGYHEISLVSYAYRNLTDERAASCGKFSKLWQGSYGFREAYFKNLLAKIRNSQSKSPVDSLLGLDIGGGVGLGAYDAEQIDSNLNVTNLTTTTDLGVWPLRGGHRFLQAERLPNEFFEKFDIIFSYNTFKYIRYRGVAMENAIRALKPGGIMSIHYSNDCYREMGQPRGMMIEDIDTQFQRMRNLHDQGVVKFLPVPGRSTDDARYSWENKYGELSGRICLMKMKSMNSPTRI